MIEMSTDTGMQTQTATKHGDEDHNSGDRRIQRERLYRKIVEV